jgi:hypothetical protein
MAEKYPTWTRRRVGRNQVHWVAYDDRAGAEGRVIVDQGFAPGLVEADNAARAALAGAGLYRARRTATTHHSSGQSDRPQTQRLARSSDPGQLRPRQYLYTRRHGDQDGGTHVRAHLVLRRTAKKVYVTERSCWTGQLGTEDEAWSPTERTIALDRARLERDGSVYSTRFRDSGFYATPEEAAGDSASHEQVALGLLGLRTPCTLDDIKAAYRRRALEVHPDRGGAPGDFQAAEDAYRRLLHAAEESP